MSKQSVDLTILKRLVSELELALAASESVKANTGNDKVDYIVEMNKAIGICTGIFTESGLLISDIQSLIQGFSAPNLNKQDILDKIFGGLKGPGSSN